MQPEVTGFSVMPKLGKIPVCENTGASTTPIGSKLSAPPQRSKGSSAIPKPASSGWFGGGKNGVRRVRHGALRLLRPQGQTGAGSLLRRYAGVPRDPDPPGPLSDVRQGEAGNPRLSLRQPLLHEAVRLLRGKAMPRFQHQGRRQRTAARLAHGQGAGEAVPAGAASPGWDAGPHDHRHRRGLDPEGPPLPDRGERPGAAPADLVRRGGPLGSFPGHLLRLAGERSRAGGSRWR